MRIAPESSTPIAAGRSTASGADLQLTYCTNIHPGAGWAEVYANIRRFAPRLKARLSPNAAFGLGLRLSAREASELLEGDRLRQLKAFLDAEGLYVALINGFPYGPFHGTPVKADVYAPDWRDDARVRYTLDLIAVLRVLLPDGMEGGISTAPLSYKPWLQAGALASDWNVIVRNVARIAETLVRTRVTDHKHIHLDIEPEPDCLIETTGEAIAFFDRHLLPHGSEMLAEKLGIAADDARAQLLEHVQLCFDCCHAAVEYEEPEAAMERIAAAGVRVGRIQLSSALRVSFPQGPRRSGPIDRLHAFADSTYLHQVIERQGTDLVHFADLNDALGAVRERNPGEWRVHFHVPLFTSDYDGLSSTQTYVADVLRYVLRTRATRHLEIETYTWDVLPSGLKVDLEESIAREYEWVLQVIEEAGSGSG